MPILFLIFDDGSNLPISIIFFPLTIHLLPEGRSFLAQRFVIIEPDNFDCAVFGDKLFVFHPVNFYYLFVPTDILKESILEKREEIGETISDPDMLISAANRPSKVRDLYYFVSQGSKIPEKEEIKKDLEILNQYGVKEKLFSITEDNKITCTEENASLVLSYISKKLGLRISDKRLLNVEASSQL